MPRNALLDESKDQHWPLGFGWCGDKIRLQGTLAVVFDQARPATLGKGDFLLHGALRSVLIEGIVAGHWRQVYDTLGMLLGLDGTAVPPRHGRDGTR